MLKNKMLYSSINKLLISQDVKFDILGKIKFNLDKYNEKLIFIGTTYESCYKQLTFTYSGFILEKSIWILETDDFPVHLCSL